VPLDPTARALLDQLARAGRPPIYKSTVAEGRAGWDALAAYAGPGPELPRVEDLELAGANGPIPARLYAPASDDGPLPTLVWYHGGGFVIGGIESYDHVCRVMAADSGCAVISVDYRLAPEHPFPAGVEDAYAAFVDVAARADELGLDGTRIGVGGDSAGGNLTCVTTLMARDQDGPKPVFQLLVYPGTDFRTDLPSYTENGTGYLLEAESIAWFTEHYFSGGGDESDWRASPLRAASLADLPPAHVITAEFDPIRDYGEQYAWKLMEAGVPVSVHRYPGMIHGFVSLPTVLPAGKQALAECTDALRVGLAGAR
jgi:acetyl esterase